MRRVLLIGLAMVLVGCESLPPPTPLETLNVQQMHGHEVFQAYCARCHNDRKSGGKHGPSLLGVFKRRSLPSGLAPTDERVTATIVNGRGQMRAMGGKVNGENLDDLLAYLHTL